MNKKADIRTKLLLLFIIPVLFLIVMGMFGLLHYKHILVESRQAGIKQVVETAYGSLEHYYNLHKSGILTEQQARKRGLQVLEDMSYANNGYFWVNNTKGRMLMHPYRKELVGSFLHEVKDPQGQVLFESIDRIVGEKGEGFVRYSWTNPASENNDYVAKISYVKLFEPWGWVIGSGIYTDDINRLFIEQAITIGAIILAMVLFIFFFGYFFLYKDIASKVGELRLFRSVLESTSDAVIILGPELEYPGSKVQYVNRSYTKITGRDYNDIVGSYPVLGLDEETQKANFEAVAPALRKGQAFQGEMIQYRSDGSEYWSSMAVFPVYNEEGNLVNCAVIERDITREKEIKERLEHSHKLETVGRLTGGIAHDFNNMLAVIMGNLESLADIVKNNRRALNMVDTSMRAARRSAELTEHLLLFSRRQILRPQKIELNETLSGITNMVSRMLKENININLETCEEDLEVYADISQLENALVNLVINSSEAMPEGGTIKVCSEGIYMKEGNGNKLQELEPGRYAVVQVTDYGCGMSRETKERAFEPFFSTKKEGSGTGLGLSTVYGFAVQSGGSVSVSSKEKKGTTVRLYLPCCN